MSDPKTMPKQWLVLDPDNGPELFDSEADARRAFDVLVDHLREEACEGWHEGADQAALYRLEPVARFKLVVTARAEDDSEEGRRCAAAGWDYIADGVVEEVS